MGHHADLCLLSLKCIMYFQIKNVQTILRGPGGASLIRANVGQTPIGVGVNFNPRAPGAGAPGAATGTRIIRLPPSALAAARPGGGGSSLASQRIIRSLLPNLDCCQMSIAKSLDCSNLALQA